MSPTALFATVLGTVILFVATALISRATLRRAAGALIAAAPLVPLIMAIDARAGQVGLWRYPSVPVGHAPLAWYIASAVGYGAAVGLLGWRVLRRYGTGSVVVFVLSVGLFGLSRDYVYSVSTRLIEFGRGPLPWVADFFSYACAAGVVQAILWGVAGPPRSDPLARRRV